MLYLGVDLGTSSVKVLLVDEGGVFPGFREREWLQILE